MLAGRDFTSLRHAWRAARGDRQRGIRKAIHRRQEPRRNARTQPHDVTRLIVGYVRDAVYESLRDAVPPTLYIAVRAADAVAVVHIGQRACGRRNAGSADQTARGRLAQVHRELRVTFSPLADQVQATLTQERIVATLSAFFGALGLLLAGPRPLRCHGVWREPAADRDRHSAGARRRTPRDRHARPAPRRDPHRHWNCRGVVHEPVGVTVRRAAALRPAAARSIYARRRRSFCWRPPARWPPGFPRGARRIDPAENAQKCGVLRLNQIQHSFQPSAFSTRPSAFFLPLRFDKRGVSSCRSDRGVASMVDKRIVLPQGTLDLLILKVLSLGPQHGWAISERLDQVSTGVVQVQQGIALSRAAPARAAWLDQGRVGPVRQQP